MYRRENNMNDSFKLAIFSGLFWKFGERILAQSVSFLVSVILARLLMPSDYGTVALVLVFINLANVFVTSGFSTALIQKKDATELDFSTNFYCSLGISCLVYFVMFLIAPFIEKFYGMSGLSLIIRVFSLRIPISAFSSIQHAYVERYMLFKRYFFSTLFGTIISGVVGITLAYLGFGVWALIAQYFTNTIVDIIVLMFTVPWRPKLLFSFTSAKDMMSFGSKILLADLSGTFFNQLRSLIIGKFYTSSDLAFYNKGNQLPNLITTNISSSVMTVLFPAISNINDNVDRVKKLTRKSFKTMAYVIFPLLVGMACVAKPLVEFLFAEKWMGAVPFIQILSISSAIDMIGNISLQTIKALGRSDIILKLEIYKKPVYIILLIAGAFVSPLAVAASMLLYTIYGVAVNAYTLSKVIDYPLFRQFKDILDTLIMCLLMSIVIYPISLMDKNPSILLISQTLLGIFVYLFMSKLTNNESFCAIKTLIKEKTRYGKKV